MKRYSHFTSALIPGLLGGLVCFLLIQRGITLSPDGWAYWEGSVSILSGDRYQYFGGQPITAFPPLFSFLLSGVQSIFSVSGRTLIGTTAVLAAVTSFAWSYLLFIQTGGTEIRTQAWLGALYISLFVGTYYTSLVAEILLLPMLAGLMIMVTALPPNGDRGFLIAAAQISVLCALAILTKNAALAFIPPILIILLLTHRGFKVKAAAALLVASSVIPWLIAGQMLGQTNSHRLSWGGSFTPSAYFVQIISDTATRLGPSAGGFGYLVLGIACAIIAYGFFNFRHNTVTANINNNLIFLFFSTASLYILFNLTSIHDPLSGRFLWQVPLLLIATISISHDQLKTRGMRYLSYTLLVAALLIQFGRTSFHIFNRETADIKGNISPEMTIRTDYFDAPPITTEDGILIVPPTAPWIHRLPKWRAAR